MKTCNRCKEELPVDSFAKNKSRNDGLNSYCKICQKEYFQQYYKQNKRKHIRCANKVNKRKQDKNRSIIDEYKTKCNRCGETEKCCLEFHYIDPSTKIYTSSAVWYNHHISENTLRKQIKSCEVICTRCHNLEHFNEKSIIKSKIKKWLREFKSKLKCKTCGFTGPAGIHLHHLDPKHKEFTITNFVNKAKISDIPKILKEIKKTVPLCGNCHKKVHAGVIEI